MPQTLAERLRRIGAVPAGGQAATQPSSLSARLRAIPGTERIEGPPTPQPAQSAQPLGILQRLKQEIARQYEPRPTAPPPRDMSPEFDPAAALAPVGRAVARELGYLDADRLRRTRLAPVGGEQVFGGFTPDVQQPMAVGAAGPSRFTRRLARAQGLPEDIDLLGEQASLEAAGAPSTAIRLDTPEQEAAYRRAQAVASLPPEQQQRLIAGQAAPYSPTGTFPSALERFAIQTQLPTIDAVIQGAGTIARALEAAGGPKAQEYPTLGESFPPPQTKAQAVADLIAMPLGEVQAILGPTPGGALARTAARTVGRGAQAANLGKGVTRLGQAGAAFAGFQAPEELAKLSRGEQGVPETVGRTAAALPAFLARIPGLGKEATGAAADIYRKSTFAGGPGVEPADIERLAQAVTPFTLLALLHALTRERIRPFPTQRAIVPERTLPAPPGQPAAPGVPPGAPVPGGPSPPARAPSSVLSKILKPRPAPAEPQAAEQAAIQAGIERLTRAGVSKPQSVAQPEIPREQPIARPADTGRPVGDQAVQGPPPLPQVVPAIPPVVSEVAPSATQAKRNAKLDTLHGRIKAKEEALSRIKNPNSAAGKTLQRELTAARTELDQFTGRKESAADFLLRLKDAADRAARTFELYKGSDVGEEARLADVADAAAFEFAKAKTPKALQPPSAPQVRPQPGEVAGVKQAWEMTQAEWIDEAEYRYADWHKRHIETPMMLSQEEYGVGSLTAADAGEYAPPEPSSGPREAKVEHRVAVATALRQGKPVPPEVLRDYPDLERKVSGAVQERKAETVLPAVRPQLGQRPGEVPAPQGVEGIRAGGEEVPPQAEETLTQRSELRRLESQQFKTHGNEVRIAQLKREIAADPSKWTMGQGVGWYAGPATKDRPGSQINRGFQIVEIDAARKLARIRQVADTGITVTGGADRLKDEWVHIADLVRDKKYDGTQQVERKVTRALPLETQEGLQRPAEVGPQARPEARAEAAEVRPLTGVPVRAAEKPPAPRAPPIVGRILESETVTKLAARRDIMEKIWTDAARAYDAAKKEYEGAGLGTKRREQLERKLAKLRESRDAAFAEDEKARKEWRAARLKQIASTPEILGSEMAGAMTGGAEVPMGRRQEIIKGIEKRLTALIPDALELEKDYKEALTPEERRTAASTAVENLAEEIASNPLIGAENTVKDLADRIRGGSYRVAQAKALDEMRAMPQDNRIRILIEKVRGGLVYGRDMAKALSEAREIAAKVEVQKVEADKSEKDRAVAAAQALKPIGDIKASIAQAWKGSMSTEPGRLVSDGFMAIDTSAISEADAVKLRGRMSDTVRRVTQKAMEDVWKASVRGATRAALPAGLHSTKVGDVVVFDLGEGKAIGLHPQKYAYLKRILGPGITLYGRDARSPIVFKKAGKPVALLMPVNIGEEIDLTLRGGASRREGPLPGGQAERAPSSVTLFAGINPTEVVKLIERGKNLAQDIAARWIPSYSGQSTNVVFRLTGRKPSGEEFGRAFRQHRRLSSDVVGPMGQFFRDIIAPLSRKEGENLILARGNRVAPINDKVRRAVKLLNALEQEKQLTADAIDLRFADGKRWHIREDWVPPQWNRRARRDVDGESGPLWDLAVKTAIDVLRSEKVRMVKKGDLQPHDWRGANDEAVRANAVEFLRATRNHLDSLDFPLDPFEEQKAGEKPIKAIQLHQFVKWPREMLSDNLAEAYLRHLEGFGSAVASRLIFGRSGKELRALARRVMGDIRETNPRAALAAKQFVITMVGRQLRDISLDPQATAAGRRGREALGFVRSTQGILSLGAGTPFIVFNPLVGTAQTMLRFGIVRGAVQTLKALPTATRDIPLLGRLVRRWPPYRRAQARGALTHDAVAHMFGELNWGRGAADFLTGYVRASEAMLRTAASEAGVAWTRQAIKRLHRKHLKGKDLFANRDARQLLDMDFTHNEIAEMAEKGSVEGKETLIGAKTAVDITQYMAEAIDLPLGMTSPWGRVIFQFSSMAYKHMQNAAFYTLREAGHANLWPLAKVVGLAIASAWTFDQFWNFLRGDRPDDDAIRKSKRLLLRSTESLGVLQRPVTGILEERPASEIARRMVTPAAVSTLENLIAGAVEVVQQLNKGRKGEKTDLLTKLRRRGKAVSGTYRTVEAQLVQRGAVEPTWWSSKIPFSTEANDFKSVLRVLNSKRNRQLKDIEQFGSVRPENEYAGDERSFHKWARRQNDRMNRLLRADDSEGTRRAVQDLLKEIHPSVQDMQKKIRGPSLIGRLTKQAG